MTGRRSLYLSYDGITDPLGRSQVLPYVLGLADKGHRITLVSFEKPERSEAEREAAQSLCAAAGVRWIPLRYHKRPPVLSTVADLARLRRIVFRLQRTERFEIVHCRSYLTALIGLALKRRHGVRLLFDMRGFWADERVEGGLWNLDNPIFRAIYTWFKRAETRLLRESDHVVSLTEAGRDHLLSRRDRSDDGPPISVIPCCADFDQFPLVDAKVREAQRKALSIPQDAPVAAYLGSIGTWYMLDEMLDFFRFQRARDERSILLLVTRDEPQPILAAASKSGIPHEAVRIRPAKREDVATVVTAADYGLFFIRPTYSKQASSPTKLGEFLAMGLPVVTNAGVGDVDRIVTEIGAGVLVHRFGAEAYSGALDRLSQLEIKPAATRLAARHWFDLEGGIAAYDSIYRTL